MLKVFGSFLVPLVIGVFTVVITIQQYQVNEQNRSKDLEIAARQRDQEQTQADTLHQETVYADYIKEIAEFSLKLKTENLSSIELDQQWKLARAKTLSALRQLNTKHKSYVIQFLYETDLIFTDRPAIYLGGADLSGIILTSRVGLPSVYNYISLTYVVLTNASFVNLHIMKANLSKSILNNANFSNAYLFETNFTGCDLINADLRGVHAFSVIIKNANLTGAIFGKPPPEKIQNSILPNGSYAFYSNDFLQTDLFNQSVNLIINGNAQCQTNINSTEIFGWQARFQPVAIVTKYSELPSFIGNITINDCVFWGGTLNSSKDYLHQRVYFPDYTRLIDAGRAIYELSYDSGGIDGYNDSFHFSMAFRAVNSRTLESWRFPMITNIERKNRSISCHQVRYGPIPSGTRSLLVNVFFRKWSNSPFNNGFMDNIAFYIKQMKKTDEHTENTYNYTCL